MKYKRKELDILNLLHIFKDCCSDECIGYLRYKYSIGTYESTISKHIVSIKKLFNTDLYDGIELSYKELSCYTQSRDVSFNVIQLTKTLLEIPDLSKLPKYYSEYETLNTIKIYL